MIPVDDLKPIEIESNSQGESKGSYIYTVVIGEDTMVNKIVVVDEIVHLGPPLGHCRGLLYKIVW